MVKILICITLSVTLMSVVRSSFFLFMYNLSKFQLIKNLNRWNLKRWFHNLIILKFLCEYQISHPNRRIKNKNKDSGLI